MIRNQRRTFLLALGTALPLVSSTLPTLAFAQGDPEKSIRAVYPVKPIRILAGYSAGTGTDLLARLVAQKLSEHLGQPVVVENRVGAQGTIATELVAKSTADGYTLQLLSATVTILPAMRKVRYDIQRDFAPVSLVAYGPFALVVHASVPARNVKELIALARSQPGKLHYGSAGVGSSSHLAGELFKLLAKVSIVQVPYKGATEQAVATAANEIEMSFPSIPAALPLMEAGKVRALGVTSAKRVSVMASIPTLDESGLRGYDRSVWYGVVAPAGVPKDIIARVRGVIDKAVNTADVKESLNKQGLEPQTSAPEEFATRIRTDLAQNAQLIRSAGVKVE
ncbi:MAG: tripartite tricarboxylate transporter substrate binding protein [Betaproteobacteria bacterium]|nr:tripartite tricarboxylate transporter substrate binding protein [Betaproteobacteria bacterium]